MTGSAVCVDVFWARVRAEEVEDHARLLSPVERERMARLRFDRDRAAFATAHGLLRRVLGSSPDAAYSGDFVRGGSGKPALPPPGLLQFNLSHAQGMVAVALCQVAAVGVDVEPMSKPLDAQGLAASVLAGPEIAELEATGWQIEDFLARWVMKEALAKAHGSGLQTDFRQILLCDKPLRIAALPPEFGAATEWSTSLQRIEGHVLCAAVRWPDAVWRWHGHEDPVVTT